MHESMNEDLRKDETLPLSQLIVVPESETSLYSKTIVPIDLKGLSHGPLPILSQYRLNCVNPFRGLTAPGLCVGRGYILG